VLSSAYLEKGEVLLINSLGLDDGKSKRKIFDGFTYFGCKKSIKKMVKSSKTYETNDKMFASMGATGTSEEVEDPKY